MKKLAQSRFKASKVNSEDPLVDQAINQVMMGMNKDDEIFTKTFIASIDTSYIKKRDKL